MNALSETAMSIEHSWKDAQETANSSCIWGGAWGRCVLSTAYYLIQVELFTQCINGSIKNHLT